MPALLRGRKTATPTNEGLGAGVALDTDAQGRQDACPGGCIRFTEETILEAAAPGGLDWPHVERVQRGDTLSVVLLVHPCALLWTWAPMACRGRLDAFFAAADGRQGA